MDEKDKRIAELETSLKVSETELAKTKQTLAGKTTELSDAETTISELKALLEEVPKQKAKLPTLSVGKKTYELTEPSFNYGGKIISIEVLKENVKLAEELVKEGVSYLRRVD